MKQILFNDEARKKLAIGADTLAKAVVATLGPRSGNVAIKRNNQTPLVAHDGVTVAKAVTPLKDEFENMGAELLKEASFNTNALAGDGTTTSTLIANTLIQEGMELTNGSIYSGNFNAVNRMELRDKLNDYAEIICKELDKRSKKLKKDDIYKIAKMSSSSDSIAKLVTEAIGKVGEGGLVMSGTSESFDSYVEHKDGMEFDNGYLSPYFVTNPHKMIVEYPDSYVLLADKIISDPNELAPILEEIVKKDGNNMPLIVIANDVVGLALQGLVQLKLKGMLPTCAIMSPEFADRRKEMLEDLAVITGGVVLSPDKKDDLKKVTISHLGRASVRVTPTHTVLTPKFPDKEEIDDRAEAIREQIKREENSFRKERLEWRLSKITQGLAVIKVGGASEAEVNDKKLRIEDAVHAVRAALLEGAVVGGGMTLYKISDKFTKDDPVEKLVRRVLKMPFEALMSNSGLEHEKVLSEIVEPFDTYDVVLRKPVKAFESGIIDPVKVTKMGVKHAFSVAGMFLTTDVVICDEPDKDIQKMRIIQNENA